MFNRFRGRRRGGTAIESANPPSEAANRKIDPAGSPDGSAEHYPDKESIRQSIMKASAELRLSLVVSVLIAVHTGLTGYLGYRLHEAELASHEREQFIQAGRQAAINLTTISYNQVDADVARILDSAVGTFRDEFQNRAEPFIDVVKAAQSTTEGNVTAAGLESIDGDRAKVIVAVSVRTSTADSSEHQPKGWRMRMSLQRIGDTAKVSDVEFVP